MASITARKNKNGIITSYTIRVFRGYDGNGKRVPPYRLSYKPEKDLPEKAARKQAEQAAAEFERQCKSGGDTNGGFMRLSEFAEIYLKAAQNTLAPRTVENYRKIIRDQILPQMGHIKLVCITPGDVQEYINRLAKAPRHTSRGGLMEGCLAPTTVRMRLSVLQTVLSYAVKLGYIGENPAHAERLILPRSDFKEVNIFTKEETVRLLAAADDEPLWFRTLINLAVFTGLRKGELSALKYSDVDMQTLRINVSRSSYKLKGEKQTTKSPKSGKERIVSINRRCADMLAELRQESGGEFIFHDERGEMLPQIKITRDYARFLKKNGFAHRKFHSLRHTSATLLLYSGTDIKTVQSRLGHANISTTNRYLHLVETADKDAVERLESFLEG